MPSVAEERGKGLATINSAVVQKLFVLLLLDERLVLVLRCYDRL